MKNLYKILGVESNASVSEIKSAFRRIAKETHPDMNGGKDIYVERFREAVEAYSILSNEESKKEYDLSLTKNSQYYNGYDKEYFRKKSAIIQFYMRKFRQDAQPYKDQASSQMLKGIAWLVGGLVLTYIGYAAASEQGGRYTIFYGAIIFGGWQALVSFAHYNRINDALEKAEAQMWKDLNI